MLLSFGLVLITIGLILPPTVCAILLIIAKPTKTPQQQLLEDYHEYVNSPWFPHKSPNGNDPSNLRKRYKELGVKANSEPTSS